MKERLSKKTLNYLQFECESSEGNYDSYWIKLDSYSKLCLGFYDNQRFASECHLISLINEKHEFPIRLPKTVEDLNLLYFTLSGNCLEY